MELEHSMMRSIVRISHNGRRKHHKPGAEKDCKHRGYGHILSLLSKNNGLTQQQIAQLIGIRPQSASEAVKTLEEQGLIERLPNPQDKRSFLLYITPEGIQRRAEIQAQLQENAQRIFAPLSEDEKNTLHQLLEKVVAALEENEEEK